MSIKSLSIWGTYFIFLLCSISSSAQRSSYGETCNKTQRCDRRSWLGCISGKCECLKPDEMVFEPRTGKCASKAGERCKYALEHLDGSRSFEYTSCVENSICGEDGFCACTENCYEHANGTCSPPSQFSEPCNEQAKCSSLSGLVCNNGICTCSDRTSVYSSEEKQCVGLAGRSCILSKCIENANCTSNGCTCKEGYYQNVGDTCSRRSDLGGNCTSDDQCKYEGGFLLKCIKGSCKCDPSTSIFGTGRKHELSYCDFVQFTGQPETQCLGKVDNACIEGLCASGSYCNCENRCQCIRGFDEPSAFGTCGLPYDFDCRSEGPCHDGLVCKVSLYDEVRCRCRYSEQNYDTTIRKCTGSVGAPCDEYTGCEGGAECVQFEGSSKGICQCRAGYVENDNNNCDVSYGMPCDYGTARCDGVAGLNCIDKICQCDSFKEFDPQSKLCVGLAGAKCAMNATEQECFQNSECSKVREGQSFGRCTCLKGYVITSSYTCTLEKVEFEKEGGGDFPVLDFPVVYDDVGQVGHWW